MTVPQTGTIHKQAKNMDIGANQAQAQAQLQPLIQTQIPHQPQTSPPLRRLPDPTIPSTRPVFVCERRRTFHSPNSKIWTNVNVNVYVNVNVWTNVNVIEAT